MPKIILSDTWFEGEDTSDAQVCIMDHEYLWIFKNGDDPNDSAIRLVNLSKEDLAQLVRFAFEHNLLEAGVSSIFIKPGEGYYNAD